MHEESDRASFGYRDVSADEKAGLVRDVFDKVASRYDLMNDLMSGGVHRIWKAAFITRMNPQPGERLVDVAGGTGDIALGWLARTDSRPHADGRKPASATLVDINHEMLKAGAGRRDAARYERRITRICGDAERLPIEDRSADTYTIAFGIRNVTNIDAALREAWRVLRPGGKFCCLEFSHPVTEGLQKVYDLYSFNVIPKLGEVVAGDRDSYQYLVESIRRFPTQDQFAARIEAAGFSRVSFENLTAGVAAIHLGRRI